MATFVEQNIENAIHARIAARPLPPSLVARAAAFLAKNSTPEGIAYQERHIDWMRRCLAEAATDTGPRYQIGAEMDRAPTAHSLALAEEYLAECRAYAASLTELDRLCA